MRTWRISCTLPVLLVVFVVIAASAHGQDGKTDEARAIARIRELRGGVVRYESPIAKPVIEVDLTETDVDDADLALLTTLTSLRRLSFYMTGITDAGLTHLKGLTNLEELDLSACGVRGPGLVHLRGMPRLRSLSLHSNDFADKQLVHVRQLDQIEMLDLSD